MVLPGLVAAVDLIYDHLLASAALLPPHLHGACLPVTTWVELEAVALEAQKAMQARLDAQDNNNNKARATASSSSKGERAPWGNSRCREGGRTSWIVSSWSC